MNDLLSKVRKGNDAFTKSRLDVQFLKNITLEHYHYRGYWSTDERRGSWSKLLMVFTFNFPFICDLGRTWK